MLNRSLARAKLRFGTPKSEKLTVQSIYLYSYRQFGEAKAENYHQALVEHFDLLAQNPAMGRDFSFIKAHTRRSNCISHAIYYQIIGEDVLILRVLHQSRDPARHLG